MLKLGSDVRKDILLTTTLVNLTHKRKKKRKNMNILRKETFNTSIKKIFS